MDLPHLHVCEKTNLTERLRNTKNAVHFSATEIIPCFSPLSTVCPGHGRRGGRREDRRESRHQEAVGRQGSLREGQRRQACRGTEGSLAGGRQVQEDHRGLQVEERGDHPVAGKADRREEDH